VYEREITWVAEMGCSPETGRSVLAVEGHGTTCRLHLATLPAGEKQPLPQTRPAETNSGPAKKQKRVGMMQAEATAMNCIYTWHHWFRLSASKLWWQMQR